MKTVTIGVASRKEMQTSLSRRKDHGSEIRFASVPLLLKVLTERRLEILRTMQGAGAMSLRELARRLKRDVKQVHGDAKGLSDCGILQKTESGQLEFPYEAVRIEFELKAA